MEAPARTFLVALKDAVRSTTFLSAFVGIFQGVICLHRKVASKDHKLLYWIAGGISALSVLLEKKARRGELALYVLPRAGDSLWYILVNRHLLPDIKNAEVFLFCLSMGGIMYYLEHEPDTMAPFLRGLIRRFLASRISNPVSASNRSPSYTYLQSLDAMKKPKLLDSRRNESPSRSIILNQYRGCEGLRPWLLSREELTTLSLREPTRMDIRLFEASHTGDVQLLHKLLAENPLLLHSLALASTENPLHVASIAGHVDFVKEIVRLKPAFVKELNQEGFSPMHIASANGYFEIVRELLKVDPILCRLNGRDQWTPLHYAAARGRVDVVGEMVLACPESVEDVTIQGETALHLAVKNSQFEAIKVVVELAIQLRKANVLNMKDKHGNTALHLATWKKQHQVKYNN
ncbi:ankyrin repeat-containing protein BDA1 [Prunus yedoensis var. nudiflora]|uniref:Ankyrin repeat-containing protein BDA1 n=2 Tax=Prunus yedoensis var. nudiflora TaxID=2094558 RepID=A0A314URT4_PRUYE|nr:ankyrin repeat-containing protein BDA1 [Prunus yedoensis var. nudiflora]